MILHNIRAACRMIALDNGGINRDRPAKKQQADYDTWMATRTETNLGNIDVWLGSIENEDFQTVCIGGDDESRELLALAPTGTDDLLDAYFEQVC